MIRDFEFYNDGISRFDCNKLFFKDRVGYGLFGDVYIIDYYALGKDILETVIIKKMLNVLDLEEKKIFLKEVVLLNGLNYRNVVKFMLVCY